MLPFGLAALDQTLGGGLACGALHEIAPAAPLDLGAATALTLALAVRATAGGRSALWIQPDFAGVEAGEPYGPGLDLFGLALPRLILLRVAHARDAAWAMEEALKCRALVAAIAEVCDDSLDLTLTRRLSLAAGAGGGLGLVLRHRISPSPSAALTRWEVASAPGERDRFGGLGRPALALSLVKNRRGPNARWLVWWDHHACAFAFAAPSRDLAPAARDGSFVRAG
jgi:protein ImuA